MTTLRTAAQQALEALEKLVVGSEYEEAVEAERAIDALRAALAEPVQEPVAWMMVNPKYPRLSKSLHWTPQTDWHITWESVPLYVAPIERNFCPRCGKRALGIHTCTPPGDCDVHG